MRTTLASIGDAVVAIDGDGLVRFMNPACEALAGWARAEAEGRPPDGVLRLVDEVTRGPVESPASRALRDGVAAGLAARTLLISRGGAETPVEDSAAPIRDASGAVIILAGPGPPAGRAGLKILVVEDEPATRRIMARPLRGPGNEVTEAGTVAEAIDAAGAGAFDLIVSDIGLPDGTGPDLMRRVSTTGARSRPSP